MVYDSSVERLEKTSLYSFPSGAQKKGTLASKEKKYDGDKGELN